MQKLGILGSGISYSLSPQVHDVIFKECNIKASYEIVDSKIEDFNKTVEKLKSFVGYNVTKPFKMDIIQHLEEKITHFDAVNTVKVDKSGKLYGYNTDDYGFYKSLSEQMNDFTGKKALLLGAGGVADIVVYNLKKLGCEVYINNRTMSKAIDLAKKYDIKAVEKNEIKPQIIINGTTLGTHEGDENPADGVDYSELELVFDTIYLNTPLLKSVSNNKNIKAIDGLDMLIYQGIRADEIFFDIKIEEEKVKIIKQKIYKNLGRI